MVFSRLLVLDDLLGAGLLEILLVQSLTPPERYVCSQGQS